MRLSVIFLLFCCETTKQSNLSELRSCQWQFCDCYLDVIFTNNLALQSFYFSPSNASNTTKRIEWMLFTHVLVLFMFYYVRRHRKICCCVCIYVCNNETNCKNKQKLNIENERNWEKETMGTIQYENKLQWTNQFEINHSHKKA